MRGLRLLSRSEPVSAARGGAAAGLARGPGVRRPADRAARARHPHRAGGAPTADAREPVPWVRGRAPWVLRVWPPRVGQPLRTVATTPSTKKLFDVLTVVVTGEMMAQFAILVVRPKVLLVTFMPWNAPLPFSARLMVQPPPSIVFLSMVTLETTPWSWVTCTPVLKAPEMLLPTIRMLLPFWIWIESSWLGLPPWFGSDWKCTLSCR